MSNATATVRQTPSTVSSADSRQPARLAEIAHGRRVSISLGVVLFLSMLPVTMIVPVLRELVSDRFNTGPFWAHFFMSINMIGAILTAPISAALAERIGRRRGILLISLLLDATVLALMPAVASFRLFMILRFMEGAFHVLAISTIMAAAGDWAPPGRRGRQMGMIGAALIFGTACGAPLGGRIGQFAPTLVFSLGAIFAIVAAGITLLLVRDAPNRAPSSRLKETLSLLRKNRKLLVPYSFAFVDRFCVGVIVSSFVLFLADGHGYSPAERGMLLALFLFPFAFLCYPAGRLADRFGRARLMIFGNTAFGLAFAAYGIVPASWLPLLMLASGVFSAMLFSPNLALCADLAPPDGRVAVYAGFNMAGSLGFLCGPLAGGLAYALLSPHLAVNSIYAVTFAFAGAIVLVCALVFAPLLLRLNRTSRGNVSQCTYASTMKNQIDAQIDPSRAREICR